MSGLQFRQLVKTFGLLLCVLLLSACSIARVFLYPEKYQVRRGDTLYAIAWRYHVEYKTLAQWNGIRSPYTIYPGQTLVLVEPANLPVNQKTSNQPVRKRKLVKQQRKAGPPPKDFHWPTDGELVQKFAGSKSNSQGIDIAGQHGQPIRAAADGRVVYSGSGLTGYGKLIIVKHNEDYLSAYAHNSELSVKEGEKVTVGQVIARMGLLEPGKPRLHFEVRKQGKPVDPLKYLPKR